MLFRSSDPLAARTATLRHAAYEPQRTPEDVLAYRLVATFAANDGAEQRARGVGATIAAGSQRWKGISAALPMPNMNSASSTATTTQFDTKEIRVMDDGSVQYSGVLKSSTTNGAIITPLKDQEKTYRLKLSYDNGVINLHSFEELKPVSSTN